MRYIALFSIITLFTFFAHSQEGGGGGGSSGGSHSGVRRKVEKKISSRWTLADWLAQKQKMKWEDQWLALNTSDNPFEFFIDGSAAEMKHDQSTTPDVITKYNRKYGRAGAYATIVGVEGGYEMEEKGWSGWDATFNLRLFGTAQQNSHITLHGGTRTYSYKTPGTETTETWQLPMAGGEIAIYLTKYFGVEGWYRSLFVEKSNLQTKLSGENMRAHVFIDFNFFRIYGGAMAENLVFENETTRVWYAEHRNGVYGGARIWF